MHLLLSVLTTYNNSNNNNDDNAGGRKPREAMNICGLDGFLLLSEVLEVSAPNGLCSLHANHSSTKGLNGA